MNLKGCGCYLPMRVVEHHMTNPMQQPDIDTATETLKNALLALPHSGDEGFEGLLRLVLTQLSNVPFRLAKSGLQGGLDGDAALPLDSICFEAKRYDGNIDRKDILVKIADLGRNTAFADRLWILGATTTVGAVLAAQILEDGHKQCISTLILDWTPSPLPLLAVCVASAHAEAQQFIVAHAKPSVNGDELSKAIDVIRNHHSFDPTLGKIRANFDVPALALTQAISTNKDWLKETLTQRGQASKRLGQALSVLSEIDVPIQRDTILEEVMLGLKESSSVILLGDEGQGKSWLAASVLAAHSGLAIFASAERFENVDIAKVTELLIELAIQQTGDVDSEHLRTRWRHRFSAWQEMKPAQPLLVVVDGINQRRSYRWDRILRALAAELGDIGGQLIVTARPQYWHRIVCPGITFECKKIDVPDWSPAERDTILARAGVAIEWLDQPTQETLKNPRLLGIALTVLSHKDEQAWKGLTLDRILFEHLLATQKEHIEAETFAELTGRLSKRAAAILDRVKEAPNLQPHHFEADANDVVETRFFRMLDGPGTTYELRPEGLVLALGLTLIEQLWQASRLNVDLAERCAQICEPIQAMDRTVDVFFAALMVCALDDQRFSDQIFSVLLDAFSNLQNVDDKRFEEFAATLARRPQALFANLKDICLERNRRINLDWFFQAAFDVSKTENGWLAARAAIKVWLNCYNSNAEAQTARYHRQNDNDYAERLQRNQTEINAVLDSLGPFEAGLFKGMSQVQGETDDLFELALELLAGRALADFANDFVALGLGLGLDRGTNNARKAFANLTKFNRVDHEQARLAFLKAIDPLRTQETSKAGLWTVVRMLYAAGRQEDIDKAEKIAVDLRKDRGGQREPPSPLEWRQINVADPAALPPINLAIGLERFNALDVDKILHAMFQGLEDHHFDEFLPVACRFAPEAAIVKERELLSGFLTRTGTPLRQLVLNPQHLAPLVTRDLALKIVERFAEPDLLNDLAQNERELVRTFAFAYVAPMLTSDEQLAALQSGHFGKKYATNVVPSLKQQTPAAITLALKAALNDENTCAVIVALALAQHGNTDITDDLCELLLSCRTSNSSMVRAACFELAYQHGLGPIRLAHAKSKWIAKNADDNTYEKWFGSVLLIDAAKSGDLEFSPMLPRIDPRTWAHAAARLGQQERDAIAKGFLSALRNAAIQATHQATPAVDFVLEKNAAAPYPLYSIEETGRDQPRFPASRSIHDLFSNDDKFDQTQARLHAIADDFFKQVKVSDLRILTNNISVETLEALIGGDESHWHAIFDLLQSLTTAQFVWFRNIAFAVANWIAKTEPAQAVVLFKRASAAQGFLTIAYGDGLTLEDSAIWSAEPSKVMKAFWLQRLMACGDDAELAQQVLAAERFGAEAFITDTIVELSGNPSNLDKAYAVTIAGHSKHCAEHLALMNTFADKKTMVGDAARSASKASDAYTWSNHQVALMWNAETPEAFFCQLTIVETCLDGRIEARPPEASKWCAFAPIFQRRRKKALENRNKNRRKTLLGAECPRPIFLREC